MYINISDRSCCYSPISTEVVKVKMCVHICMSVCVRTYVCVCVHVVEEVAVAARAAAFYTPRGRG